MNLKKKEDFKPVYKDKPKVYKKDAPIDMRKYTLLLDAQLPHGKHSGKTLQWVIENDDWYFSWMEENNILLSWGLVEEKQPKRPVEDKTALNSLFEDSNGNKWIDLILYPGNGISSPFL